MKKIVKKIVIFILIFSLFICTAKADSGWDSDYDSGGYSGGGYSDAGDYDFDFRSDSGPTLSFELFFLLIILIIGVLSKTNKNEQNVKGFTGFKDYIRKNYSDISEDEYNALAIDKDIDKVKELLKMEINYLLNAYSNFDYETIKNICSEGLSNKYIEELDDLKAKNQRRYYKDLEYKLFYIIDAFKDDNTIRFMVYSKECLIDYKIENNGNLVYGTNEYKITDNFLIEFEYNMASNKVIIINCKNINKENILE